MGKKSAVKVRRGHSHGKLDIERAAFRAFCRRQKLREPKRKGWGPMATISNLEAFEAQKADWQDQINSA